MNNAVILDVKNLSKTYVTFKKEAGLWGTVKAFFKRENVLVPAVKDLSFSIRRGEFVGLLGPNGAGKTTTLKMLTGLVAPSFGQATAFNHYDTAKRSPAYLQRIGMVMGQRNQLNPDLPAIDSFRLSQAIYALDELRFKRQLDRCLDLFNIRHKLLTPVRKLSLGERMKMELILAILHEPDLLFLDEPTIGLDFNAARQIRDFLAEANQRLGVTMVLTSHYTKDIEELCRRVILINHGEMIYDGPLTEIDERLQNQKLVTLLLERPEDKAAAMIWLQNSKISNLEFSMPAHEEKSSTVDLEISFGVQAHHIAHIIASLSGVLGSKAIVDIKVIEKPIEEVFAEIYRRPQPEERRSEPAQEYR